MDFQLKIVPKINPKRILEKDQDKEWEQLGSSIFNLPVEEWSGAPGIHFSHLQSQGTRTDGCCPVFLDF